MIDFDKQCLNLAVAEARKTFEDGNYPVGAVLTLDDKVLGVASDTGKASKSYINHAEATLLRDHASRLLNDGVPRGIITIYSTLEPCLMCLGTAAMCKATRIVCIQTDPHGGACGLSRDGLGDRYQHVWPEIVQDAYSDEPRELMIQFLKRQIDQSIRVEWSKNFIEQLKKT